MHRARRGRAVLPGLLLLLGIVVAAAMSPWRSGPRLVLVRGFAPSAAGGSRVVRRGSSGRDAVTPAEAYFESLGWSEDDIAKVKTRYLVKFNPSLENNVKPVVLWLAGLGLSDAQVRKSVVGFPRLFTYTLERMLKPKEQWLLDLGLDKSQVAKAIARIPRICGLSLEAKLKPLVK
mmetsp:Transcript_54133/g.153371  ORF Transcript_54133/g.153371 Transcript_54133/m.153371 type:complete len:176 (-) Transcript_54133:317-844(-)